MKGRILVMGVVFGLVLVNLAEAKRIIKRERAEQKAPPEPARADQGDDRGEVKEEPARKVNSAPAVKGELEEEAREAREAAARVDEAIRKIPVVPSQDQVVREVMRQVEAKIETIEPASENDWGLWGLIVGTFFLVLVSLFIVAFNVKKGQEKLEVVDNTYEKMIDRFRRLPSWVKGEKGVNLPEDAIQQLGQVLTDLTETREAVEGLKLSREESRERVNREARRLDEHQRIQQEREDQLREDIRQDIAALRHERDTAVAELWEEIRRMSTNLRSAIDQGDAHLREWVEAEFGNRLATLHQRLTQDRADSEAQLQARFEEALGRFEGRIQAWEKGARVESEELKGEIISALGGSMDELQTALTMAGRLLTSMEDTRTALGEIDLAYLAEMKAWIESQAPAIDRMRADISGLREWLAGAEGHREEIQLALKAQSQEMVRLEGSFEGVVRDGWAHINNLHPEIERVRGLLGKIDRIISQSAGISGWITFMEKVLKIEGFMEDRFPHFIGWVSERKVGQSPLAVRGGSPQPAPPPWPGPPATKPASGSREPTMDLRGTDLGGTLMDEVEVPGSREPTLMERIEELAEDEVMPTNEDDPEVAAARRNQGGTHVGPAPKPPARPKKKKNAETAAAPREAIGQADEEEGLTSAELAAVAYGESPAPARRKTPPLETTPEEKETAPEPTIQITGHSRDEAGIYLAFDTSTTSENLEMVLETIFNWGQAAGIFFPFSDFAIHEKNRWVMMKFMEGLAAADHERAWAEIEPIFEIGAVESPAPVEDSRPTTAEASEPSPPRESGGDGAKPSEGDATSAKEESWIDKLGPEGEESGPGKLE